jgi:predicted ATPase
LGADTLPGGLVDLVFDRTGGVPLFVEEILQVVQGSGLLDRMEVDDPRILALLEHETPASLQDLMMARLDRLSGEREVGQLAATLGREFNHDLLAAVVTLEKPTLRAELNKLVQGGILHQRGRWPACSYIFSHALLRDSVYRTLIKGKRQQLHRRIAEVLEAQFPQAAQTQPEFLAHHFTEAGLTEKAIGYWLQAGLKSRERFANVEAIGHLVKGLELLATLAESPERDAQELQFLNPLGTAYIASRGYTVPEVGPIFRRARELCDRIGQPTQRFACMWGYWAFHVASGKLKPAMTLAVDAMEFAERLNDPGILMEALFMPGLVMFYRGDFGGARACFARAVADYDDRARTRFWAEMTGQNAGITHRCLLAVALWHSGYPDQALEANGEMHALARALGHPMGLTYARALSGWLHQCCRRGTETEADGDEVLRITTEQGFPFWQIYGLLNKAGGLLLQGRLEPALPLLRKGLDSYRAFGAVGLPHYLSIAGEIYTRAGQFGEARKVLDEGLAIGEKTDERFQEAELYRLTGELLLAESPDQGAAAEGFFRRAVDVARRQQSRAWELRATMSLARRWHQQGRGEDARAALAAVYDTYTEGFTTPDLVDAAALLQQLAPA